MPQRPSSRRNSGDSNPPEYPGRFSGGRSSSGRSSNGGTPRYSTPRSSSRSASPSHSTHSHPPPSSTRSAYSTKSVPRTKEINSHNSNYRNYSHIRYYDDKGKEKMDTVSINDIHSPLVESNRISVEIDENHTMYNYSDDWEAPTNTYSGGHIGPDTSPRRVVHTRIVKIPVERVVEVERKVPVTEPRTRVVKVPVDTPRREVRVIRPPPLTKVRTEVEERIVEKIVEVPVEIEKEVPVERIVEKIVEVERIVEVPVERIVEVEKIVEVQKIIEVEKIVEKRIEVPVEVERIVEVEVERIVERIVERPKVVEKLVEKIQYVPVHQPSRVMLMLCKDCLAHPYNKKCLSGQTPADPTTSHSPFAAQFGIPTPREGHSGGIPGGHHLLPAAPSNHHHGAPIIQQQSLAQPPTAAGTNYSASTSSSTTVLDDTLGDPNRNSAIKRGKWDALESESSDEESTKLYQQQHQYSLPSSSHLPHDNIATDPPEIVPHPELARRATSDSPPAGPPPYQQWQHAFGDSYQRSLDDDSSGYPTDISR